jgi:drug/metabolite transporter (DMT)-like permease
MVDVPAARSRHARLAAVLLLCNAFVWGVSWWPFRLLQADGLHPLWATALVYWFAVACVLLLRKVPWRGAVAHPGLWVLALGSGLANVGFNWAVTVGDVVRVVLLFYLMPAWAVLLAWLVLGEKPQPMALLRLVIALSGVLLVLKQPGSPWPLPQSLPDYLALMGGMCFALTSTMLRKLRTAPAELRVLAMFGGGASMATAVALWGAAAGWVPALPAPASSWVLLVLALAVAFLLGNLALQYGAAHLRSATTALVMLSEIVFASASSVLMGVAQLDARTLWGGALILAAATWAALADSKGHD